MARQQGMKNPAGVTAGNKATRPAKKTNRKQQQLERRHVKQSIPSALRRIQKSTQGVITYVLDTNVIMTAWDSLFKFEEHDVCIVGQVWAELDAHKKGHSPEAWNVRQAIRAVDQLLAGKSATQKIRGIPLIPPSELINGKPHTGKLIFDFTKPEVPDGMNISLDVNHPDDRIILICLALKKKGRRVVLVSNDGSCRVKASIVGIEAEQYLSDTVGTIKGEEDLCPGFHVMPEDFLDKATVNCEQQGATAVYTLKHKLLKDVACNEFLVLPNSAPLRVTSCDKAGNAVAKTLNHHEAMSKLGITPRNPEQAFALQLLLDPTLPAVSLAGKAGSGKTYLTLAAGIYLLQAMGLYKRIIFTRSTQGSDEDIGFLPGDEKEKISPWMGALWDNIESLLDKSNAQDQKIRQAIQIASLNFMKGRSITDTLIIVDETQDLSPKALKMISTRVGEGSKIVFLGNVAQIDNPHLTEHTCGLSVFIRTLRESSLTGHVTLQNGERSAFAALAEESF